MSRLLENVLWIRYRYLYITLINVVIFRNKYDVIRARQHWRDYCRRLSVRGHKVRQTTDNAGSGLRNHLCIKKDDAVVYPSRELCWRWVTWPWPTNALSDAVSACAAHLINGEWRQLMNAPDAVNRLAIEWSFFQTRRSAPILWMYLAGLSAAARRRTVARRQDSSSDWLRTVVFHSVNDSFLMNQCQGRVERLALIDFSDCAKWCVRDTDLQMLLGLLPTFSLAAFCTVMRKQTIDNGRVACRMWVSSHAPWRSTRPYGGGEGYLSVSRVWEAAEV